MRVVAFIQARAGGTRFPGKMFSVLAGKPLVAHAVDRAREAFHHDVYLVVPFGEYGQFEPFGVQVLVGPEHPVHERFVVAAAALGLRPDDVIVRLTADDPLKQVELMRAAAWQAAAAGYGDTNHAFGLEGWGAQAFTVHYLREHPDPEHVVQRRAVDFPVTVDTPDDLIRLEALCAGW